MFVDNPTQGEIKPLFVSRFQRPLNKTLKYMNIIFLLISYQVFLYFECGKVIAQYQRGFSNCSKEEGLSREILLSNEQ